MKIKFCNKIIDLDKKSWDGLAKYFYMKYDVLNSIEQTKLGKEPFYIQVFDEDKLIGICVSYIQRDALYYTIDKSIYGKYNKILKCIIPISPSLISFCPYNSISKMYEIDKNYDEIKILNLISSELNRLSILNKCNSSAIFGVENEETSNKINNYNPIFSGYNMKINTEYDSFEYYLKNLKKTNRNVIKREDKDFIESNVKYNIIYGVQDKVDLIIELFKLNSEKYNSTNINNVKELIEIFEKNKLDNYGFILGYYEKELFFASMFCEDEDNLIACSLGQKKISNTNYFFNLVIYEPIKYAIKKKLKFIELGTGSYRYKKQRGAIPTNIINLVCINGNNKKLIFNKISQIINNRNIKKHNNKI